MKKINTKQITAMLITVLIALIIYFSLCYCGYFTPEKENYEMPKSLYSDILLNNGDGIVLTKVQFKTLETLFVIIIVLFASIIIINARRIFKNSNKSDSQDVVPPPEI